MSDDAHGADAELEWVPRRLRWVIGRWPGRIAAGGAAACVRIDVFDRAMTVAAQVFSSVLPILILFATWSGASATDATAQALQIPDESRAVMDDAVQGAAGTAFGVVGVLIVLVSATSLSRAVTRAFTAVWALPRPRNRLGSAWRWLAAVVGLALSIVVVRQLAVLAGELPQPRAWQSVTAFAADTAVTLFLPWVLLAGAVRPRLLLPGALLFAVTMLAVRPASAVWLPRALDSSADRFGSIGVAFTYLAWLYVVSLCFLVTAVIGRVVVTDDGQLGRWLRG
ncbi:YhjD/YihY/BrkB family envelope integrity protein [Jiangella endophytica]|uniref:YhjD/YihY/BrkB family envelope integrity protein n=1 Tax=Jiangella endophytica TaxID=1623398 RepID=UPI001300A82C|nr:YhjD/YihY/BrkB family envelope integrity protein [Jiangella endophytica]